MRRSNPDGRELQLEDVDRTENRELVELDPLRRVAAKNARCSFEKSFLSLHSCFAASLTSGVLRVRFIDAEHTNPPGIASTSTTMLGESRNSCGKLGWNDRPELDDGVVAFLLDPAGAGDHALLIERQARRVEEVNLADLGLQRVHVERLDGRALIRLGNRQLQLHAVGVVHQAEQLAQLIVRELRACLLGPGSGCGGRRLAGSLVCAGVNVTHTLPRPRGSEVDLQDLLPALMGCPRSTWNTLPA